MPAIATAERVAAEGLRPRLAVRADTPAAELMPGSAATERVAAHGTRCRAHVSDS